MYVRSLRESLGISADGSEKVYRLDDIEAFEKAVPQRLVFIDRDHRLNVKFVFTAVDPSGGGASAFSIASVLVYNGLIQVCTPCPSRSARCLSSRRHSGGNAKATPSQRFKRTLIIATNVSGL